MFFTQQIYYFSGVDLQTDITDIKKQGSGSVQNQQVIQSHNRGYSKIFRTLTNQRKSLSSFKQKRSNPQQDQVFLNIQLRKKPSQTEFIRIRKSHSQDKMKSGGSIFSQKYKQSQLLRQRIEKNIEVKCQIQLVYQKTKPKIKSYHSTIYLGSSRYLTDKPINNNIARRQMSRVRVIDIQRSKNQKQKDQIQQLQDSQNPMYYALIGKKRSSNFTLTSDILKPSKQTVAFDHGQKRQVSNIQRKRLNSTKNVRNQIQVNKNQQQQHRFSRPQSVSLSFKKCFKKEQDQKQYGQRKVHQDLKVDSIINLHKRSLITQDFYNGKNDLKKPHKKAQNVFQFCDKKKQSLFCSMRLAQSNKNEKAVNIFIKLKQANIFDSQQGQNRYLFQSLLQQSQVNKYRQKLEYLRQQ